MCKNVLALTTNSSRYSITPLFLLGGKIDSKNIMKSEGQKSYRSEIAKSR